MILIDPSKLPLVDGPSEVFNDCPIGFTKEEIDILVKYCGIEAEPKHGRWLIHNILDYAKRPTGRKVGECSVCGQLTPEFRLITEEPNWNYCPHCGARMGEVRNEAE